MIDWSLLIVLSSAYQLYSGREGVHRYLKLMQIWGRKRTTSNTALMPLQPEKRSLMPLQSEKRHLTPLQSEKRHLAPLQSQKMLTRYDKEKDTWSHYNQKSDLWHHYNQKKRHLTQLVKDGELAKRLQCAYSFEIFKKISLRIMIYDRPSSIGTHWEALWIVELWRHTN